MIEKLDVSGEKKSAEEDTASKYCETLNNLFTTVTRLLTEFVVQVKQDCV